MPDPGPPSDPAEDVPEAPTLRSIVMRSNVLRLLAIAALGGLLFMAHLSSLPWLAHLLAILALVFVFLGWCTLEPSALRRADPVRALRNLPDMRLNAVLDAMVSPTILIDHRGNMVHGNTAALRTLGGLRLGHPVSFALRAPAMLAALETVLAGQAEARAEIVERVPIERSYDIVIRRLAQGPVLPANGVAYAVIFMTDTTSARRLEAMRADFVANASHELRTPLASILGFIETLQGPARDDAAARRNFLGIMEKQARRMARLIEDLLSLSKIELNAHIPPADTVDLPLLLRSVSDALGGLARDRGVQLRFALAEGMPPVTGDRDELVRVFENLIENAIKYGQSGGKVDIVLEPGEGEPPTELVVHVRDYGPGIAEEHLPRLTERFYRADIGESRVLGGTGLGLAIVKHIVTRHRGRMAIASTLGEGATFSVTLPVSREEIRLSSAG
ncbi:MAG: ATP-binding protein [Beijerinckiaceae bacterium]|nr:ATP-binding protein [Beijerinckiaceae bacterium]